MSDSNVWLLSVTAVTLAAGVLVQRSWIAERWAYMAVGVLLGSVGTTVAV